jgi:HAD superfamily hydrolase (TIGR01549 family)
VLASLKKTEVLLLDFDDTLVDYYPAKTKALHDLFRNHKLEKNLINQAIKDYTRINLAIWAKYEEGNKSVQDLRIERFAQLQELYRLDGRPQDIDIEYRDFFVQNTEISDETRESLKMLKESGTKLIIVSNGFMDTQKLRLSKLSIVSLFDGLVTSEQVGKAKPDTTMLQFALKSINMSKDVSWMIGDSLKTDIASSNNFHIPSCYITNGDDQNEFSTGPKPSMSASSFTEFSDFYLHSKNYR